MIKKTKQNWSVGKTVIIGFMKLKVMKVIKGKGDAPDVYQLEAANGTPYEFVPFRGLSRGHEHTAKLAAAADAPDGIPAPVVTRRPTRATSGVAMAGSTELAPALDTATEAVARTARRGIVPRTVKEAKDFQSIFDRQRDEIGELREALADEKATIARLEAHIVKQDNLITKLKG